MKIAIHKRRGSFSDGWIQYCRNNAIDYKIVNCYDTDIISQLEDCDGLMWHWNQEDYRALRFARQLTISLQNKNILLFPNLNTSWHFDDKLGQKYLMESINAPFITSYAFYDKRVALEWFKKTTYPKIFKLSPGASGINVFKIDNYNQAKRKVNKAFGRGYNVVNRRRKIKDRFEIFWRKRNFKAFRGLVGAVGRIIFREEIERFSSRELGYVLVQDFIPDNSFDTRLIVVGNRCFGTRRYCRPGDFRASGSGIYDNRPEIYDLTCIKLAFEISDKIGAQSIAYDFIYNGDKPVICEVSYIYCREIIAGCNGYWDRDLNYIEDDVNAERYIIEDFIKACEANKRTKIISFPLESANPQKIKRK